MSRNAVSVFVASMLLLAPELARACAVCGAGAGEDGSRIAYLVTTLALSVLPLAMFGGFLLWVRARARRQARANAQPAPSSL